MHQMISEGYHHKFQKGQKMEEKPEQPMAEDKQTMAEDKQAFIDAIQQEENAILLGGLRYA